MMDRAGFKEEKANKNSKQRKSRKCFKKVFLFVCLLTFYRDTFRPIHYWDHLQSRTKKCRPTFSGVCVRARVIRCRFCTLALSAPSQKSSRLKQSSESINIPWRTIAHDARCHHQRSRRLTCPIELFEWRGEISRRQNSRASRYFADRESLNWVVVPVESLGMKPHSTLAVVDKKETPTGSLSLFPAVHCVEVSF